MNETNGNLCLDAFNKLCDELSTSKLVGTDECQYWMFERGYKAALNELINNMIIAAKYQVPMPLNKIYLNKKAA